ncbi:tRNA (adenosine(37)-N6)-threonylcarbamoyltransferase complex ATPase subunit type 1 TsaE [Altererythrobacter sp. SALINAS58]|uniref:tRNA (adenosine(37)-N6)-threonylcarbamoyltransferase complex ATPase subunit type 1 TsaE n=1 Tax=Alteripontixanthobacter muriae TaxID=2705546 RepID=UPI0015757A4C|nr:tRNA (adenosine(37)-N6)-threonylcarbamoyltransferase complex ATPase subunit type 1 TsaE [Alteripontixanthobacter muriae]NTZ42082.1 tRNA (adenosine(37)-N6)-threonylcarbamoyltransferase complex ATPase subunit type 1 TsaE [Alteripontixanthobacter muriae]
MIRNLPNLAAMREYGRNVAAKLCAGDVVALTGRLGAGKTTLAREIIAALGHEGEVPSPTFTVVECYDTDPPVVHADFYRLNDPAEAQELGLDDYREGAVLIAEWPDKAGGFETEPACLSIHLEIADEGRIAIARPGPDWLTRLP